MNATWRATSGIGSVSFRCSFDFAKRAIKFNTYSPISELNSSIVEEQLPGYWLPNWTIGLHGSQSLVNPSILMPTPSLDVFLYVSVLLQVWPPLWPQNSLTPLLWKKILWREKRPFLKDSILYVSNYTIFIKEWNYRSVTDCWLLSTRVWRADSYSCTGTVPGGLGTGETLRLLTVVNPHRHPNEHMPDRWNQNQFSFIRQFLRFETMVLLCCHWKCNGSSKLSIELKKICTSIIIYEKFNGQMQLAKNRKIWSFKRDLKLISQVCNVLFADKTLKYCKAYIQLCTNCKARFM